MNDARAVTSAVALASIPTRVSFRRIDGDGASFPRVGLTARHLNTPTFPTRGGTAIRLRPQLRSGAALQLSPYWVVAVDLDLTRNKFETIDGLASRVLAIGSEYRASVLGHGVDLRVGAHRNLSRGPNRDVVITLGAGVYFGNFRFDLAGSSGLDRERFQDLGRTLPRRLDVSTSLRWTTEF